MKSERWQQIERLCHEALKRDESQRAAFLEEACQGDESLRREVEDLLAQETRAEDYLEAPAVEVEAKAMAQGQADYWVGRVVGSYEIVSLLGTGGMGEVYLAQDTRLERKVALKFLPDFLQQDPTARRRLLREAKLAASLDHPFICKVYDTGETEGRTFIAMEYVEGETLQQKLARGPLTGREALRIATEMAEALEQAHRKEIVHRDLKPSNVMLTDQGHVKVMDFGIAKRLRIAEGEEQDWTTTLTAAESVIGTLPYMSPEQVRGRKLDTRSDLFSFGVVLYEMLTGEHPFRRPVPADTVAAILEKEPVPLSRLSPEVPAEVQSVVTRLLAKDPGQRYQTVSELGKGLLELRAILGIPLGLGGLLKALSQTLSRPRILVPLVLVALAAIVAGYWYYSRTVQIRWAREEAIPTVERLIEEDKFVTAFDLALQAEQYLPEDPVLKQLWPQISLDISVETEPTGADVYVRNYRDLDGEWRHLGRSPVEGVRLPLQSHRWRVSRQGYVTVDRATGVPPRGGNEIELEVELRSEAIVPNGMVYVEERIFMVIAGGLRLAPLLLDGFLIDRFEVTNSEFRQFVDAGGYRGPQYWQHEFVKDGRVLSREEGMAEFRDPTGRPGPSTWRLGTYAEGKGDFPVAGVSWYEAAAYAEFVGKSLPTVHQWHQAANIDFAHHSVPLSNFAGEGLAPVGTHQGISRLGAYDMAGNVREWCWNASTGERFILGGARGDEDYMFVFPDTRSPFDRAPGNGFRCVKYEEISADLTRPIELLNRDYASERPVDDSTFVIYRNSYAYDQTDLNAQSEAVESGSQYWNKERVTFDAAYGGERVIAYLFLPKAGIPPYQTVVAFPGVDVFAGIPTKSDNIPRTHTVFVEPIVISGRALLYPIYKGSYERRTPTARTVGAGGLLDESVAYRDEIIMDAKDLFRSIDYLETRSDIAPGQVAYLGWSYGALLGPVFLALEERLKVAVLRDGGFSPFRTRPEIDPLNFISRVKQPVLLLNGRYDPIFLLDRNQRPRLELLGTSEQHQKRVLFESAHARRLSNNEIKEILDWLDLYLGPVKVN